MTNPAMRWNSVIDPIGHSNKVLELATALWHGEQDPREGLAVRHQVTPHKVELKIEH